MTTTICAGSSTSASAARTLASAWARSSGALRSGITTEIPGRHCGILRCRAGRRRTATPSAIANDRKSGVRRSRWRSALPHANIETARASLTAIALLALAKRGPQTLDDARDPVCVRGAARGKLQRLLREHRAPGVELQLLRTRVEGKRSSLADVPYKDVRHFRHKGKLGSAFRPLRAQEPAGADRLRDDVKPLLSRSAARFGKGLLVLRIRHQFAIFRRHSGQESR